MSNDLTPHMCSLLTDPQSSIRVLITAILGRLYAIFVEVLLVELGSNSKINPTHIRAIKETAKNVSMGDQGHDQGQGQSLEISIPMNRVDSGTGGSLSSMSSTQSSPCNSLGSKGGTNSNRKQSVPNLVKAKSEGVASRASGLSSTGRGISFNSKDKFANTTGHPPSFSRNSSANSGMSADSNSSVKDGACFSPYWYLSLLSESKTMQTIYPSSEKDLIRIFNGIITEIRKDDDWQARVSGLGKLQALVTGICYATGEDGDASIKNSFIQEMKSTPVSDLVSNCDDSTDRQRDIDCIPFLSSVSFTPKSSPLTTSVII